MNAKRVQGMIDRVALCPFARTRELVGVGQGGYGWRNELGIMMLSEGVDGIMMRFRDLLHIRGWTN